MPRVKAGQRKRTKKPKTRSGCKTCKIRRIKCDETKPCCMRCTSSGRICDGFEHVFVFKKDKPVLNVKKLDGYSAFECKKELRAFEFFQEKTKHELSGLYDCEFWDRVVLQATFVEPGIRHAVIALASLHEAFLQTGEAERTDDDFALMQYNCAIRQHLGDLEQSRHDPSRVHNYLAACLLFICIEVLQAHYVSALSLIYGATRILREIPADSQHNSAWPLEVLETHLCRLQTQAVGLTGVSTESNSSTGGCPVPPRIKKNPTSVPHTFESIREARESLEYHTHMLTLTWPNEDMLSDDFPAHYLGILSKWSVAFESMLQQLAESLTERQLRAVAVLQIRSRMAWISIDLAGRLCRGDEDEAQWDRYEHIFAEVVEIAEFMVSLHESNLGSVGLAPAPHLFTLDYGVVGPLYNTATACRDPHIRRRAIRVLKTNPCREGLWDWTLAARVAERVMIQEEEGANSMVTCAADVPPEVRIGLVVPTFQFGARQIDLELFKRYHPAEPGMPISHRETIEW